MVSSQDASLTTAPNLTSWPHPNFKSSSSNERQLSQFTMGTTSISPNLMWMLMPNSHNLLFASSTGTANSIVSNCSTSSQCSSVFNTTIMLSVMQPSVSSSIALNQSEHQHHHLEIIKDSYSWLATYLVEANMPHTASLNYLSLCLLSISFLFNLYLSLAIFSGRTHRSRTNSLMQNIFVSNLLFVVFSLIFEVHIQLLQTSLSYFGSIGHLMCKVVPSLQLITE